MMTDSKDYSSITNVNLSINNGASNLDGSSSSSQLNNSIKNVHGFVHGHIHRHKDHTHIHGHIHSHDLPKDLKRKRTDDEQYFQPQNATTAASGGSVSSIESSTEPTMDRSSAATGQMGDGMDGIDTHTPNSITSTSSSVPTNVNSDLCPLDDLPLCEVLCTELDDCYYVNCDDARLGENGCIEPHQLDTERSSKPEPQTQQSSMCGYEHTPGTSTHTTTHHNNLCEPDNDKTLFDHIFNEFRNNTSVSGQQPPDIKPNNANNPGFIDVHYPHEIHPLGNTHKAFFHANVSEQNLINEFGDYDFHFQFDNTATNTTNSKRASDNAGFGSDLSHGGSYTGMSSSNSSIAEKSSQQARVQELNDIISCKWDNCYSHLNTDGLVDHIFNDHIKETNQQTSHEHQPMEPTAYSCEWLNCSHTFNELDSFLDHLNSHRNEASLLSEPTENHYQSETPRDHKNKNLLQSLLKQESYEPSTVNKVGPEFSPPIKKENIENIKISNLKVKKKNDLIDPDFTCKWETTDANGNFVPCNKKHKSAGDLQEHLINDHIGSGLPSYNCNWIGCERHNGKNFPQRQKLLRHIHVHTNFRPWKCHICSSSFAVEAMLVQHLRVHSGEKPFKCSICGKKFATSSSLSIHNRVHTGEKPLTCKFPGCNKKFSESSNLTKHMRTHSKIFDCPTCGAQFEKKAAYLKHMKEHDKGETPLPDNDIYQSFNTSTLQAPAMKLQKTDDSVFFADHKSSITN